MATKKLKVQGYVEQSTFDLFEAYKQENELSQSQALEKILANFFGGDRISQKETEDYYSLKMDWQYMRQELKDLQERIARLEIANGWQNEIEELESELDLQITSNPSSNLLEITSELLEQITSNPSSNLLEITSEPPDEITSESPDEISSNPSSNLLEITSEPPDEITSNPLEITSEPPEQISSDLPSESQKLVVCKLYKNNPSDPQSWRYWAGDKAGFVEDLNKAKTYTDKGSSRVINRLLEDELHKPTSRERISCRALEELTALAAKAENREPIEITSELPSQPIEETLDYRFVVCKFDKSKPQKPEYWRYWADDKAGFVEDLTKASLYTSEMSVERLIAQLLEDEMYKPTATEKISWRVLKQLIALGAVYEKDC